MKLDTTAGVNDTTNCEHPLGKLTPVILVLVKMFRKKLIRVLIQWNTDSKIICSHHQLGRI